MKRLAICIFYDEQGIVDDYMMFLLTKLREHASHIVFVSNGAIKREHHSAIENLGCEVLIRENVGFDVGAYKAGLKHVGFDSLAGFDEVLLLNHTFYGPIYPFSELFSEMDTHRCDFWGITAHKEMTPNPFTQEGTLPRHFNSHFIAVRRSMAESGAFRAYWEDMPVIESYVDSILRHESRFTAHFESLGFVSSIFDNDTHYGSAYPCFIDIDEAVWRRCPILKRRLFFHDPLFLDENAVDLPRALEIIRQTSDYDESLIWQNILRTTDLRTLNTNAALQSVLPPVRLKSWHQRKTVSRIAVCAHIYYLDLLPELLSYARNIPGKFDFIATTDSKEKQAAIEQQLSSIPEIENYEVRMLEVNRGRDMGALFIACRDLFLDDRYDLVCRIHTKKSPQVMTSKSNLFKRHLLENLIGSRGFVENVLDLFDERPWVGLAVPPLIHIGYPTMGQSWFSNKERAVEVAASLGLNVKFDADTPVAAYGTMFWFRPKALRKLFEHAWSWEDFNAEPNHVDGGLAHVLERLIAYCAQDSGFATQQLLSLNQASWNYAMLERKYQSICAEIPPAWTPHFLRHMLGLWKDAGYPIEAQQTRVEYHLSDKETLDEYFRDRSRWRRNYVSGVQSKGVKVLNGSSSLDFEASVNILERFLNEAGYLSWMRSDSLDLRSDILEYLSIGWSSGSELLALFDSEYYLAENPDVAAAGINPLVHFVKYGAANRRNPHPLFDTEYFLERSPAARDSGENALLLFLKGSESASPHILFDNEFYRTHSPEVSERGLNQLVHYIKYGGLEGRDPHPLFSSEHYFRNCPAVRFAKINPLVHYLTTGHATGLSPHPQFDPIYYREVYGERVTGGKEPLSDFLEDAHSLRDPSRSFSASIYLQENPDVAASGINPLVHFVMYGQREGRRVVPSSGKATALSRDGAFAGR